MMSITLFKALEVFRRELGCSSERELMIDFVTQGIEWLLSNGGGDILHEWRIPIKNGRTTLPRTLGTPLKYKFRDLANGGFGTFATAYTSFTALGVVKAYGIYDDWDIHLDTTANRVYTQYPLPSQGAQLLLTTTHKPDIGKQVMVNGMYKGMPIAGIHRGKRTSGELLTIYHQDDPKKKISSYRFDEITGIVCEPRQAYTMLSAVVPQGSQYFLSHIHPDEDTPVYREIDFYSALGRFHNRQNCQFELRILGRINPSIRYIMDEDILPIPSLSMLTYLAKRAKYIETNNYENVATVESFLSRLISKHRVYVTAPAKAFGWNLTASGATTKNV